MRFGIEYAVNRCLDCPFCDTEDNFCRMKLDNFPPSFRHTEEVWENCPFLTGDVGFEFEDYEIYNDDSEITYSAIAKNPLKPEYDKIIRTIKTLDGMIEECDNFFEEDSSWSYMVITRGDMKKYQAQLLSVLYHAGIIKL